MKSEIKEKEQKSSEYPKLMICEKNLVVLFTKEKCGTVVSSGNSNWPLGDYCEYWDMHKFVGFKGVVELSND
jgi:hypothetical protein